MKVDQSYVGDDIAAQLYRHPLLKAINSILGVLAGTPDPARRRVRWTPQSSSLVAVLMSFEVGHVLGERLEDVSDCLGSMFKASQRVGGTYNGLLKALVRQAPVVQPVLSADLRRQTLKLVQRSGRWILLPVDGTKVDLPRTRSNEQLFGIADNGVYPQAFLTVIVHAATGLVWDWRQGPARASEKRHFIEMIPDLPKNALLLCDGNFVGYPIWSELLSRGVHFIGRIGANVSLVTNLFPESEVRLDERAGLVYVWPRDRRCSCAPLTLRLVKVGRGKKTVYLLTSVLDPCQLSRKEVGDLYRQRWGIEIFYRSLKRTMGFHKLRSASGKHAEIELWWAVVGLATALLLAVPAMRRHRKDPSRISPAQVLKIIRRALRAPIPPGSGKPDLELDLRLAAALTDKYTRKRPKRSRYRQKTRNTPKRPYPKPPRVTAATQAMQKNASTFDPLFIPLQFTALPEGAHGLNPVGISFNIRQIVVRTPLSCAPPGRFESSGSTPRVALRFTRGYLRKPLPGQNNAR